MNPFVRNPENVDFAEFPPPRGYVVASEADLAVPGTPVAGWKVLFEGKWRSCTGPHMRRPQWTYLRPKDSPGRKAKR